MPSLSIRNRKRFETPFARSGKLHSKTIPLASALKWDRPRALFTLLVLKLLLAPSLVALATSAGYRFGPRITGWIAGFPVVAGPILLLFSLERGPVFGTQAAESSLLGVVSLSAFCVMYTQVARNYSWFVSLLSGWICFGGVTFLLQMTKGLWWSNALIALASLRCALWLLPRSNSPLLPRTVTPSDIPARILATAVLVVSLTAAADGLGSHVSGLLTPFPVVTSVIAVFAQRDQGLPGAVRTLQGLLTSMSAYVTFCAIIALTLPRWGIALSFTSALVGNVVFLLIALGWLKRARQ